MDIRGNRTYIKQASEEFEEFDTAKIQQLFRNARLRDFIQKWFLRGVGAAAAIRGAFGLGQLARRQLLLRPMTSSKLVTLPTAYKPRPKRPLPAVAVPTAPGGKEKKQRREKAADFLSSLSPEARKTLIELGSLVLRPVQTTRDYLTKTDAESVLETPYAGPVGVASLAGGSLLGWYGMDKLMDWRRKSELDARRRRAEELYHRALNRYTKLGSALDKEIGELYDHYREDAGLVKQAFTLGDIWNHLANLYGLYAVGTGGLAGLWAYRRTRKMDKRRQMESALKRHMMRQELKQPAPIWAYPESPAAPDADSDSKETKKSSAAQNTPPRRKTGLVLAFAKCE